LVIVKHKTIPFGRECGITFRVYPLPFRNYTLLSHIKGPIFAGVKQNKAPRPSPPPSGRVLKLPKGLIIGMEA